MLRIYTPPDVTGMMDLESFSRFVFVELECIPVSSYHLPVEKESPVALIC